MSFAFHGNWCGPGWTAGQKKTTAEMTAEDFEVPAVDALDLACKHHDIGLFEARTEEDVRKVNEAFYRETAGLGIKASIASTLVSLGGPSQPNSTSLSNLRRNGQVVQRPRSQGFGMDAR